MGKKSKVKGSVYERELVGKLTKKGFPAERAWGSNGLAFGENAEVDLRFESHGGAKKWLVQAKRRAKLPQYLLPTKDVDFVIAREDYGQDVAVVPLYLLLALIQQSSPD